MDFNGLTEEQKAKARECKSPEELLDLAQKEGVELSIDELDAASGGWESCNANVQQQDLPFD